GMGRGKDTVRRHLWRAVLQLMKPAHRTEFLTVPLTVVVLVISVAATLFANRLQAKSQPWLQ
ncbi:hypothetical protein, partial [Sinorhizobium meliloti]|uniref:hypothetical protein n=1 Tax=Rhizobium meliloti TaxID=382 RepID=UPI001AECF147